MAVGAQKARLGRGLASLIGGPLDEAALGRRGRAAHAAARRRSSPGASTRGGTSREASSRSLPPRSASAGWCSRSWCARRPRAMRPSRSSPASGAGGRRSLPLHEVPVVVRALSDQEAVEIAIIENVQREDLNAIEEGEGYRAADGRPRLHAGGPRQGHRQEPQPPRQHASPVEAARRTCRTWCASGALSAGHARALIGRRRCLGACRPHR